MAERERKKEAAWARTDGEDAGEQRAEHPAGGPGGGGGVPGARPPQRVEGAAGSGGGPGRGGRRHRIHYHGQGSINPEHATNRVGIARPYI